MKTYKIIPSFLQRLVWLPTRLVFKFFCNLEIKGFENIKTEKNVIFAANHTSEMDPILVATPLPFFSKHLPLFYTCREKDFYKNKKGLKKIIYGGNFFKAWGGHRVYVGIKDYEKALVHHIEILNDGGSVCIFPEGKKNIDNQPLKAKGGVAFLAHKTQLPIVPVYINGAQLTSFRDFFLRKKMVKITFGEPIYPKEIFGEKVVLNDSQNDYETAASFVMDKIKRLSQLS